MNNMQAIDFLTKPSSNRLRKEIQNICDSYSHSWDVIAELCQNSVDAIVRYNKLYGEMAKKDHKIDLTVNAKERSIRIYDTGLGFSTEKFAELIGPHGTDKLGQEDIIGEKGVGLTYTIFTANYYELKTTSIKAHIEGYIEKAALWRKGSIEKIPLFKPNIWEERDFDQRETFTEILLSDIEPFYSENEDIFYQNLNVLEHLLRTKTALGHLKKLFEGRELKVSVGLSFIDLEGKKYQLQITPTYTPPS